MAGGRIANAVDALYRLGSGLSVDMRVTLVAQITFEEEDPYHVPLKTRPIGSAEIIEADFDELLDLFLDWSSDNVPPNDGRFLLSGFNFEGTTIGYARLGTFCSPDRFLSYVLFISSAFKRYCHDSPLKFESCCSTRAILPPQRRHRAGRQLRRARGRHHTRARNGAQSRHVPRWTGIRSDFSSGEMSLFTIEI